MIHVLLFELRRQLRGLMIAILALVGILVVFMIGAFPIYRDAKAEVIHILEGFPPQFATAFGLNADIFTFAGFYRFSYLYLALAAAITGASWGLSVFSREKRSKTSDFLLVMPVSRNNIFLAKLLVCLIEVLVLGMMYCVAVMAVQIVSDQDTGVPQSHMLLAALSIPCVSLVFVSFGTLLATLLHRIRSVAGLATVLGLLGFIMVSLPELTGEEGWRILSPLTYFNQATVLKDGHYEPEWMIMAAVVTVVCLAASWVSFARKEVPAS